MAVAAEVLTNTWEPEIIEQQLLPLVISVAEIMPTDLRAERLIRSAGACALENQVEVAATPETRITSLMDAIHQAAEGNETARKLVEMNVRTDVIERTIKAGHILKVELDVDEDGALLQHGQTMEAIQANTLRFGSEVPQMRRRAEAETRNAYRIENLRREGWLEDYYFVVFSRAADDMTKDEMKGEGFFVDTMSCAIQATTARSGKIETESGFVAGTTAPGAERHDRAAVKAVGDRIGQDYDKPATKTIDRPTLVHKSLMPNGVIDLVRWYDEVNGTFFGEAKPRQDYLGYREICAEREKSFEPKVQAIVADLVHQSASITTPQEATERLAKLSDQHMVEKAIEDDSINPQVFGSVAARHIEDARYYKRQGDEEAARHSTTQAKATSESDSCPGGAKKTAETPEGTNTDEDKEESGASGKIEKMTCPFCGDKNQYGDPCSPNQHCKKCNARVIGGKVVSKGNGGKKANAVDQLAEILKFERKKQDKQPELATVN